jgi:hypothetical protein
MVGLRRNRYLSCFYCGRKTSTKYDGRTTRFDCPNCDATNWLDEVSTLIKSTEIDMLTTL